MSGTAENEFFTIDYNGTTSCFSSKSVKKDASRRRWHDFDLVFDDKTQSVRIDKLYVLALLPADERNSAVAVGRLTQLISSITLGILTDMNKVELGVYYQEHSSYTECVYEDKERYLYAKRRHEILRMK